MVAKRIRGKYAPLPANFSNRNKQHVDEWSALLISLVNEFSQDWYTGPGFVTPLN